MREIRLMHVYLNRQVFRQLLVGMVAMFVVTSVSAQSPRRVALLIGNAAYEAEKPLRNPINDVNAIATVLRNDLGFNDVKVITNARRRELVAAVERFGETARGADAALFYFSGHGQQQGKSNYLLPVDAKIETPAHVKSEGLDADDVQAALESASPRVSLLILDACRNNPFSTRTRSSAKGLTRPRNPEEGTLIAFATRDGDVADDGAGNNSPYAQALVNGLKQANRVPIQQMFDEISDSVKRQTENKQRPTKYGDLKVNIYLVNPTITVNNNAGASGAPGATTPRSDPDEEAWKAAQGADTVEGYEQYLSDFRTGRNISAAKIKLAAAKRRDSERTAAANAAAPRPTPQTASVSTPTQIGSERVVRIGHVGPTSGRLSGLGKDNERGARLAVDEANAKAITIGGERLRFELLAYDDASDVVQATNVARQLVNANVVGVIGHLNSGTSISASAIYEQSGIVQISPSATSPRLTNQGFKSVFRVIAHDWVQGTAIGNYAVAKIGKAVAIIDDKTAYGAGLADETERAVKAAGGRVVIREALANDHEQDFKDVLTRIKAKNPDVIMFGGMDGQAGPMLKQMKALGIAAKFFSGDGAQSAELLRLSGDAAEGSYATSTGLPKEHMPQGAAFYDKFKAAFNANVMVYAPYTYDATNVLIEAIQKTGSLNGPEIINTIKERRFSGVAGTYAFDERGDLLRAPVTIFQVRNGRWVVADVLHCGQRVC